MKNQIEICGSVARICLNARVGQPSTAVVDVADLDTLDRLKGTLTRIKDASTGRFYVRLPRRTDGHLLLHRWLLSCPDALVVDHINHDSLDNRRSNLRIATASENQLNRAGVPRNNTSGHRGVWWSKRDGTWAAGLSVGGQRIHIGTFDDADIAKAAWEQAVNDLGLNLT